MADDDLKSLTDEELEARFAALPVQPAGADEDDLEAKFAALREYKGDLPIEERKRQSWEQMKLDSEMEKQQQMYGGYGNCSKIPPGRLNVTEELRNLIKNFINPESCQITFALTDDMKASDYEKLKDFIASMIVGYKQQDLTSTEKISILERLLPILNTFDSESANAARERIDDLQNTPDGWSFGGFA